MVWEGFFHLKTLGAFSGLRNWHSRHLSPGALDLKESPDQRHVWFLLGISTWIAASASQFIGMQGLHCQLDGGVWLVPVQIWQRACDWHGNWHPLPEAITSPLIPAHLVWSRACGGCISIFISICICTSDNNHKIVKMAADGVLRPIKSD